MFKLVRNVVHGIRGYVGRAYRTRAYQFALFYKRQHTWKRVFDDPGTMLVHLPAEADWVGKIPPHGGARLLEFTKQERFFRSLRKQCLNGFKMGSGHCENVCSLVDQRCRQRLTAQTANVCAFLCADLHRIETRRLATDGVHTSGGNFYILAISN